MTYQEVYLMEELTIEAKAIYGMLSSYVGTGSTAYPSVEFMCDKLHITKNRFYKHMKLLIDNGIVEKKQEKKKGVYAPNIYTLIPNAQYMNYPYIENEDTDNRDMDFQEMKIEDIQNEANNINNFNNNNFKNNNIQNNNICPESVKQTPDPSGIQIPLNDKTFYDVPLSKIRSWAEAYPAVDVRAELLKMKAWSESNPKRAKTRKGITRFINSWLSKEQDSGGRYRRQSATYKPSTEEQARLNRESYEQQEKEYQEWKRQQEEYKLLHRNDPVEEDSIWG